MDRWPVGSVQHLFYVNADVLIGSVNHSESSPIAQGNEGGRAFSSQLPEPKVVKNKSMALRGTRRDCWKIL